MGAVTQLQLPLIQQRSVQAKMKFHMNLASLEVTNVPHAQKLSLVYTFSLGLLSVHAVVGTSIHPTCSSLPLVLFITFYIYTVGDSS